MNRTILVTAASVIALCAGSASAAGILAASDPSKTSPLSRPDGAKLLWNQNSNYANNQVDSQNFTGGTTSSYNDQAADDFVIPKGRVWTITEVDVTGVYFNGSGPAMSEDVVLYKDSKGMPGKPVKNGRFTSLNGTGGPDFAVVLPGNGVRLKPGHYWVSVIANQAFDPYGEWGWEVNNQQHHKQAMWQNPSGGFGVCPTWGTIENCYSSPGPDLMFDLQGTSKEE
jgi:hypothetical protein